MNRQIRVFTSLMMSAVFLCTGCQPTQPFFFKEDGDLSHYLDVATEIEYPDVDEASLSEVQFARSPLTLTNAEDFEMWDLTLEEVTRITLTNSQVMRQLGGRIADGGQNVAQTTPETIAQGANSVLTTYDPAITESGNGTSTGSQNSGTGVEAALAEFDARLDASIFWQNNDRPQNFAGIGSAFFANDFRQDLANATFGITKRTANGSTFEIRNNTIYDLNNNGSRAQPSDWTTNLEAAFVQPLLQGAGTQYNRIAGPQTFQQSASGIPNQIDGIVIARIRHDISLMDFEEGIRNMMRDVEDAYWELYFAYRDLEARKIGRDSALETWRKIKALQRVGQQGGEADKEAQSRSQYFLFSSQVESALTNLFRVENRLRYLMGLSVSDGRLIRPSDEPTTALVNFDWATIHSESLSRRAELRKQKWQVKKRELELIASRNHLLPRLDAVGRYRWLGAGDQLLNSSRTGIQPFAPGSNAFEVLTGGRYQEWELGIQANIPIGFRLAITGVRHYQLLLARERAVLQDLELEVSHQLGDSIRDVDLNYRLTESNFSRRVAAEDEVEAVEAVYDSGRVTLDLLLDAQRRRADAESSYYRSLVDYNRAIMRVHFRKGSLLEYNGVLLAEGPWPGKAYFDALRRARRRDAGKYMDYGFTRPNVFSRGPVQQPVGELQIDDPQIEVLETPTSGDSPPGDGVPHEEGVLDSTQQDGEMFDLPAGGEIIPLPETTDGEDPVAAAELGPFVPSALPPAPTFTPENYPTAIATAADVATDAADAEQTSNEIRVVTHAGAVAAGANQNAIQPPIASPKLHNNPFKREFTTRIDAGSRGLPNGQPHASGLPGINPFRPAGQLPQPASIQPEPLRQVSVDETQTTHTADEAAANTAGR